MAGTASGAGNLSEEMSSGHRCQSGEAIAEWRSSEQLENGTPSTSPPYWDSDDENDSGPKPADLYGKYTWKIEKFSHINKRELRSSAFEVGSYKWYILIYPQGCDVCNHLSLFLCVANHDKLLPGWSHFAQFTIAVVNKDPKKSKYSDTLHRFWKKEHDWGWKKFMELSKVLDGFVEEDTLIIKAQVQVIREKADRPFRCLDCQYRRELVRVYLTNVEQICRRFVEERRSKLVKLIEDKEGWSSFCDFWSDTDKAARHHMCREKTDMILKVVVKHFFIEKEVTSTLVMDSLYSGLKALEGQTKLQKNKAKLMDIEEMPAPIIRVEKDMFVLVDDVLLLLERAAMEPLPPKDDKGPQNRTKDGSSGDDSNKDSIERDERRLTELGRRTVEIFVLAHIFSNKIEVAYKEAVAWKRQDELIREEAAAGHVDCKQKSKRGAVEKEKKSKKKQAKHKRNSRKVKDKVKDEKSDVTAQDKQLQETIDDDTKDFVIEEVQPVHQKCDMPEDTSDVSDSVDCVAEETVHPDSEDRDASPVNWDTDTSEVLPHTEASISPTSMQNGIPDRKSPSIIDDSSSTCSTDSVPSVAANGPYRGSSFYQHKSEKSTGRGKNRRSRGMVEGHTHGYEVKSHPSEDPSDAGPLNTESENHKVDEPEESEAVVLLQDHVKWLEEHVVKKEEEVDSLQKKLSVKEHVDQERHKDERSLVVPSSPRSPPKSIPSPVRVRSESKNNANADPESLRKPSPHNAVQTDGASSLVSSFERVAVSKPELKAEMPKPSEKPSTRQVPSMSRPSSAPLVPAPRPIAPAVSSVQTTPLLARSVSAAGRLGPDPSSSSSSAQSSVPQSYRNVMMGNAGVSSSVYTHPQPPSSLVNQSSTYSQLALLASSPLFIPQSPERVNPSSFRPGFMFGTTSRDGSQHTPHWMDVPLQRDIRIRHSERSPHLNNVQSMNPYRSLQGGSQGRLSTEFPVGPSGRQIPSALADEFPHLDIINDLLDDESSMGRTAMSIDAFHRPHMLNRHFSFPGDLGTSSEDSSTSSSKFERMQSRYDAGYQRTYSSLGNHYDPQLEATQSNPILYSSDQVDGVIPNHWQLAGSDISMLARLNADAESYSYNMPDYANLANGINGYSAFGPSNGH